MGKYNQTINMQTRSQTLDQSTMEPHDLDAFYGYQDQEYAVEYRVPGTVALFPEEDGLYEYYPSDDDDDDYDPEHFCPSWCECCEENLEKRPRGPAFTRVARYPPDELAELNIVMPDSSMLSTHRTIYTRSTWKRHVEVLMDALDMELIEQDTLTGDEYDACYEAYHGR